MSKKKLPKPKRRRQKPAPKAAPTPVPPPAEPTKVRVSTAEAIAELRRNIKLRGLDLEITDEQPTPERPAYATAPPETPVERAIRNLGEVHECITGAYKELACAEPDSFETKAALYVLFTELHCMDIYTEDALEALRTLVPAEVSP